MREDCWAKLRLSRGPSVCSWNSRWSNGHIGPDWLLPLLFFPRHYLRKSLKPRIHKGIHIQSLRCRKRREKTSLRTLHPTKRTQHCNWARKIVSHQLQTITETVSTPHVALLHSVEHGAPRRACNTLLLYTVINNNQTAFKHLNTGTLTKVLLDLSQNSSCA